MEAIRQIWDFLETAAADPKLTPCHVSLYTALLYTWEQNGSQNPVSIRRAEIMRYSKIVGRSTYQKCIQELDEYGYIRYIPSFNHYIGSIVYLAGFPECIARIQLPQKH
jgi:hypothetical protein